MVSTSGYWSNDPKNKVFKVTEMGYQEKVALKEAHSRGEDLNEWKPLARIAQRP